MEITKEILDYLSYQAKANPRLRQIYDLRNSENDESQRTLNALEPGTIIPIHRHTHSSETVVIIRGAIRETFYDEDGHVIDSISLKYGSEVPILVVPKGIWHSLDCLVPNTIIFESKDGAYEPTKKEDILNIVNA